MATDRRRAGAVLFGVLTLALPAGAQQYRQILSNEAFVEKFNGEDESRWWRADDRVGGKRINDTGYSADNISIDDGVMSLRLDDEPYRDRGHTGASFKSDALYSYGRYDAVLKAAKGSGVVTGFYTYTGPAYGDPHDEIDFEFLGRNPRLLHLNYFVSGEAKLKRTVELPFDASEGFHLYTFEWRANQIVWSVDGEELFRVNGSPEGLPRHPGKIIAEVWAAKNLKKWAGEIDPTALPATALVRCISFQPEGLETPTCDDPNESGAS